MTKEHCKEERDKEFVRLLCNYASLVKSHGNDHVSDEQWAKRSIEYFEPVLRIVHEPGPGGIDLLRTINKVTADRQLTLQWVNAKRQPLFHCDLTKAEAQMLVEHMQNAIKEIWK